eukprot:m.58323 g.58323  ORF g.58323 m.58323 type:complete len:129 (-) comp11168_c0_seq4:553-939(-)
MLPLTFMTIIFATSPALKWDAIAGMHLGQGVDTGSGSEKNNCVVGDIKVSSATQKATFQSQFVHSSRDIMNMLSVDAMAKGSFMMFKASTRIKYAEQIRVSEFDSWYFIRSVIRGESRTLSNAVSPKR